MKLIPCRACGNRISRNASSCPACGEPLKRKQVSGCGCLLIILAGVVIAFTIFAASIPRPEPVRRESIRSEQSTSEASRFAEAATPTLDVQKETLLATAKIKRETCLLYEELLGFKDSSTFNLYGFGIGGPHNQWLQKVRALKEHAVAEQCPIPGKVKYAPSLLLTLSNVYLTGHDKGSPEREQAHDDLRSDLQEAIDWPVFKRDYHQLPPKDQQNFFNTHEN